MIIIISLILSAFFSGMEIAYVSSDKLNLEIQKKQAGFISNILRRITKEPSKFISTMLIGNNFSEQLQLIIKALQYLLFLS